MNIIKQGSYALSVLLFTIFIIGCNDKPQVNVDIPNETSVEFVKRFVETIDEHANAESYKSFWGLRVNKNVLNEPARTAREMNNAVAFHRILKSDNTLITVPEINEWADETQTVSFQYTLNTPTSLSLPGYPKSGDSPWTGYQITVEKENGKWVVSGESLTR
jgi:hypothetical protein